MGFHGAGTARFIFLRRDGLAVARSVARFVQVGDGNHPYFDGYPLVNCHITNWKITIF